MRSKLCLVLGLSVLGVLLAAAPAQAQRGRGFGRTNSLASLAGSEAVQKELGVGAAETAKLEQLADEYREALQQEMSAAGLSDAFRGLGDLPQAERDAKMIELRSKSAEASKKVNEKFEPKLKDALTADQFKRLQEIVIQSAGVAALASPDVVKNLGLSDEQQKKIAEVAAGHERAQRELFAGAEGDFQALRPKLAELTKETETKASDVLTGEQKEKFAALKGKPFDLATLRSGRGRDNN
ncbi:MAG: hypothetical protein WD872_13210 [Pirellulaceae bacterium]